MSGTATKGIGEVEACGLGRGGGCREVNIPQTYKGQVADLPTVLEPHSG